MSLSGILSFAIGGALLVIAIGCVIGDAVHATIGAGFAYGALLGFLAFFLMGFGGTLILRSLKSAE
ncbi:MAG: hypothetical protein ACFFDJ_01560 [Candidatus Odinarchaeota archaeon]